MIVAYLLACLYIWPVLLLLELTVCYHLIKPSIWKKMRKRIALGVIWKEIPTLFSLSMFLL